MSGLGNPDDDVLAAIDFAENYIQLARSMIPSGESKIFCQECNTKIPEARRAAQPGCRYCIECQVEYDKLPKIKTVTHML